MNEDIIWVNPLELKLINDHDILKFPSEEVPFKFYDYIIERPNNIRDMKKTKYYQRYKKLMEEGTHPERICMIKNEWDIVKKMFSYNILYEVMKEDPYFEEVQKIWVFIDELGHIRIYEGNHRAIIAIALGLKSIPVHVCHRHPDWIKFKDWLSGEYSSKKTLYNPIQHPDFTGWSVLREEQRIQKIEEHLKTIDLYNVGDRNTKEKPSYNYKFNGVHYFQKDHSERLKGIDIGCHLGFNCHYMERMGAIMTGVECSKDYCDRAKYMNRVYNLSTEFINIDIGDFIKDNENKYDFAIMLSVFYVISRNKEKMKNLIEWLKQNVKIIYVDDHCENYDTITIDNLKELFGIDYKYELVFQGRDGRNIYAIFRDC